ALLSGVLLVLSFPKFGHPAFGWIALAPLLVGLLRCPHFPGLRAFSLGLINGVVYFGGTLYWITSVMVLYGGLARWAAVLVNLLLVAYLALFPAIFAFIMRELLRASGARALFAAPCVWVATELGRTYIPPGGFPWVLLGYSQVTTLPIAQFASVLGVYGVSALAASVSAVAAFCVDPTSRLGRTRVVAVATAAL